MVPLTKLRRIQRDLRRASEELNAVYPVELQDWDGSADDTETLRNLDTALAHIGPWIQYRERNRRDLYLRAALAAIPQEEK